MDALDYTVRRPKGLGNSPRMMSPRTASWMQARPSPSGVGAMGASARGMITVANAEDDSEDVDDDNVTDTDVTDATSQGSLTSVD